MFRVAGEVTVDTVRTRLDTDAQAKGALNRAASPQAADQAEGGYRSSAGAASADARELQSCLTAATAAANTATRPLSPAFFIEGTYKGREATILVTTSTTQPGRVDLWVFPRDDCTAPPLTTEQVRCPPHPQPLGSGRDQAGQDRERYQVPLARANATPPLST